MQVVPLEAVKPGLKLGRKVMAGGNVLAAEGDVLTPELIKLFSRTGVFNVVLQGKTIPDYGMGYNCSGLLERLPYLFRKHKETGFMRQIHNFLKLHFEDRL